ncbi:MAG TPA: hypothetical protein PKD53_27995 [Chloroflexaceae bacterium]|nr:hypothetical protein [Chloroflexaceae bacterium]
MQTAAASRPRRPWAAHLVALGVYTLMALAVTWPMPARLGAQIIANGPGQVDGYLGIWNIWWTATALAAGRDPFVTPLLFHPQGLDLFWQTLSLPQGLLALPLTLTAGPLPAYNLLILLSFILGGYFAYLFICYALRGAGPHLGLAALVGGAVYAFAPFHMQKVLDAQLEVASVQWLPLWALATLALLERRRWPWALLSAAALLWVGLGTWYYGLFALIATGLMAGLWAVRDQGPRTKDQLLSAAQGRQGSKRQGLDFGLWSLVAWRPLLWGLAPAVIWAAVMAPRLVSLARTGDELLGDARVEQQDAIADLIAFWLPNPNHPLWGEAVTAFYTALHPGEILWNVSLGLVGAAFAIVGVAVAWRAHWRWLALGVVAAAMALGAELVVFGVRPGVPGPYALIRDLPGVRSSHRPNHFVLISILTTALFAAAGVRALLARLPRPGAPWAAAGLLAAILAVDGWAAPLPLFQRPMPAPYLTMPPADGALLPVPLHLNFSNSENLWYQTRHRWPIVGGFIGREPPYPIGRYAPGIKELRFGRVEADDILAPGWPALARETLAAYEIRYVMFHHQAMGSPLPLMRQIVAEMGLAESYRDELITVHPVPAPAVARPLAYLGPGWGALEQEGGRRWRWMGEAAQVYLLNPTGAPRPVTIGLDLEAFERARPLTVRLGDGPPFTLEVSRARMARQLRLILPPGETVLYLGAPAGAPPGQPERRLSLAVMGISIE